jgi:UDP-N-acetylglucosamine 2-epimerase (non-hydrolysing)
MAPVISELNKYPQKVDNKICVTAQHREMLDQVLSFFNISPDIDLDLMESDQSLSDLTARALTRLSTIMGDLSPDVVLVQGDTTTVLSGALAAYYHQIPVGHVEAGLRTYDPHNPFPEEINRKLTDSLSSFHFAPTETARQALLNEGHLEKGIFLTGNTSIDALHWTIKQEIPDDVKKIIKLVGSNRLLLLTAHRRENFGEPLIQICRAVKDIVKQNDDLVVVYPVHLNPNVKEVAAEYLSDQERIHLIEPLEYQSFVHLMKEAYLILTDSGGIQEEAPALGTPVLVLRKVTERPEAVEAGAVKVIGTEQDQIFSETMHLLSNLNTYQKMSEKVSPYGDGLAAERIVKILLDFFEKA